VSILTCCISQAEDTKNNNMHVAVKKMVCETAEDLNNAMKEVWSVRSLQHENLVDFKDVFFESGNSGSHLMCVVMEYYSDGDLHQELQRRFEHKKYYSEQELLEMMKQLSAAVKYLHDRKIMHRDIKPMNVFMQKAQLKLGDFGLAKSVEQTYVSICVI
jgi:NIMA (never in mitosis gene a)-related kinase